MVFFVVFIECKRWLVVKEDWVENPNLGQRSKIFFSQNDNAVADFSIDPPYYINLSIDSVYDAFVWSKFGKCLKLTVGNILTIFHFP